MAILLGLLVAASYGSADFLGGFATKSSPAGATVIVSQTTGLVLAVPLLLVVGRGTFTAHDAALSALAGIAGVIGVGCLYRGLAVGRMSVVAPLSAVGSAFLEVAWGLLHGERPGAVALVGIVIALVAIGIVAGTAAEHPAVTVAPGTEFALGAAAALGFGVVFIAFSETGHDSGLWPLVVARSVAVLVVAVALFLGGRPLWVRRADARTVTGTGVLDVTANALLLAAVRLDLLSIVAPVAALYPAGTVVLARAILREQLGRARTVGLLLAVAALAMIAVH
ncbi:MAG: EamA family transporter [Acidimicrobiia bacterium]